MGKMLSRKSQGKGRVGPAASCCSVPHSLFPWEEAGRSRTGTLFKRPQVERRKERPRETRLYY